MNPAVPCRRPILWTIFLTLRRPEWALVALERLDEEDHIREVDHGVHVIGLRIGTESFATLGSAATACSP